MKAEELRALDADELTSRLKGARRELYELRFKLAVGQLDDHRQIRRARRDIARILTIVHQRRLGIPVPAGVAIAEGEELVDVAETRGEEPEIADEAPPTVEAGETPEDVEASASEATGGAVPPTPTLPHEGGGPSKEGPSRATRRRKAADEEGA